MNRRGLHFILSSLLLLLLLCYTLQLARCQTDAYHCVWRGNCGLSNLGVSRACASNDPPKPLDRQSNSNLREKCPHYFEGKGTFFSTLIPRSSPPDSRFITFIYPPFQTHRNCVATLTMLKRCSRIWIWLKVYSAGVQLVWKMRTNCCATWRVAPCKASFSA